MNKEDTFKPKKKIEKGTRGILFFKLFRLWIETNSQNDLGQWKFRTSS